MKKANNTGDWVNFWHIVTRILLQGSYHPVKLKRIAYLNSTSVLSLLFLKKERHGILKIAGSKSLLHDQLARRNESVWKREWSGTCFTLVLNIRMVTISTPYVADEI